MRSASATAAANRLVGEIIEIGRAAHAKGLVSGNSGNISVRQGDSEMLITASGTHKGMLTPEDVIRCDLAGRPLSSGAGTRKVSSEVRMHTFVYDSRPEVRAVIHAHPVYAVAASLAGLDFDEPMLPEAVLSLGAVATAPYGTPTTMDLVASIEEAVRKGHRHIILKRHGSLNLASSLKRAYADLETLENVAKVSILARLLGFSGALPRSEIEKLAAIRKRLLP